MNRPEDIIQLENTKHVKSVRTFSDKSRQIMSAVRCKRIYRKEPPFRERICRSG
ncbi:hypothetical protein KIN20_026077 [Parelaphostrongylus tenuis]|uniref:Uncharacterized protein n=1 Tax=Parelaphostrongylus tenuis TaxID=148309 RepID=A0AAD5MWA5_PARTN|nr:hypothetical protein KIN20_026077 [Parelaphostrongylus tenuis]